MDPSSLIFLAIIAMWAAYLLGHWVRRRDQLATARSIDRFSESMRVLERRTPTRPVAAARPTARAYVVAPVRVPVAGPAGRPSLDEGHLPASGRRTARITREAARRRARLLLGLVVATAAAWLLVAATALVWWPAALVSALLAAVLGQLRRTARAASGAASTRSGARASSARSSLPVRRLRRRRSHGLAARVPAPARRPRRHQQDARAVLRQLSAMRSSAAERTEAIDTSSGVATVAGALPAASVPVVMSDVDPHGRQIASGNGGAGVTAESAPADGSWQPVPVPPPTYTLKPKARPVRRPPVRPGEADGTGDDAAGGRSAPVPADVPVTQQSGAPEFDLDEILERRIAAGG